MRVRTLFLIAMLSAPAAAAPEGGEPVPYARPAPHGGPIVLAEGDSPAAPEGGAPVPHAHPAPHGGPIVLAEGDSPAASDAQDDSPEARMARRFPQKVRVGDLIGLPVLDDDDVTLGHVREVVRSPQGKIRLIVSYSRWFGWFGRPVAVPIEAVAILAKQIASLDMQPPAYAAAPTWMAGADSAIGADEIIRIAITRR